MKKSTLTIIVILVTFIYAFGAHALQYDSLREYFTFTGALRVVDGALYIGGGTLPTGLTVLKNIVVLTGEGISSGVASYARDILSPDTASLASVIKRAGTGPLIVKTRSEDLRLTAVKVESFGSLQIASTLDTNPSATTPFPTTAGTLRAAQVLTSTVSSASSIQVSGGTNGVTITAPTLTYGGTGLVVGGRPSACFQTKVRYLDTSAVANGLDDGIKGKKTINDPFVINIAGGAGGSTGNGGHGKCQFTGADAYPVDFAITDITTNEVNQLVVTGTLVCCYGG